MPLANVEKEDFVKLSEARATQIDKDFDKMTSGKPEANKELAELDDAEKRDREELITDMKGQEAAEVADTFLQMDDDGLKTFLETFRDKERGETAGTYAMYHVAVQVLCERLGFSPGDIDGIYGIDKTKGTRYVVIQLQKKINALLGNDEEKLDEDGLLGKRTLEQVLTNWDSLRDGAEVVENPPTFVIPTQATVGKEYKATTTANNPVWTVEGNNDFVVRGTELQTTPNTAGTFIVVCTYDDPAISGVRKEEKATVTVEVAETVKVSDYEYLHPADDVPLTADLDQGYVTYEGKKVPMFRNQAIQQAFDEMNVEVKEAKDTKEATTYLKELFKDYKDQYPKAFNQDNRFTSWDRTKFDLFEQWRKDKKLDFAGFQSSDGEHYRSDEELFSWLPVRVGSEFAYLGSDRGHQEAGCYYGSENDALPVFAW